MEQCGVAGPVRPWPDGPALPRGTSRHRTPKRPLCGLLQYLARTSVPACADTEPGGPRPLAMMAPCPATHAIRLTHPVRRRSRCRTDRARRYPLPSPTARARSVASSASGRRARPWRALAYVGLHALQHRGQESAGIAVSDGGAAEPAQAPRPRQQRLRRGDARTASRARRSAARPPQAADRAYPLQHDGLEHAAERAAGVRRDRSRRADAGPQRQPHERPLAPRRARASRASSSASASDTEVLAKLIAHAPGRTWAQRVDHAFHRATGAYTFTMLTADALVAARDPIGFRPLALGRLPGGGWAVARESAALDAMGAQFVRDVEAGEVLTITPTASTRSGRAARRPERERLCVFEFVYLARPDSVIDGRLLYEARLEMGRAPGPRAPGRCGPRHRRARLGDPGRHRLCRGGRTAVPRGPDQVAATSDAPSSSRRRRGREEAVRLKFNPLPELLAGKRVVVVDDSIVRGTTTGADRRRCCVVPAPPRSTFASTRRRCATRATWASTRAAAGELIASTHSTRRDPRGDRRRLARLPVARGHARRRSAGDTDARCTACFDGIYPTDVPLELDKLAMERR